MKRILFSIILCTVMVVSTNALAQNQSYKPYNWTGLYFGLQGSYLTGDSEWESHYSGSRLDHNIDGGMGGFFIGYNYQTPFKLVVGIETEMNFGRVDGSSICPNSSYSCHTDVNWIGSTHGRFGYALDRFLPYVTIGWAYGGAETYMKHLSTGREYGSDNGYFGFTPGIGFEFAITKNLLVRAEYSFYYFFKSGDEYDYYDDTDVQIDASAFKVGLSFKF
ncbi:MAG: outer membrane beta-barrel protein [Deltaproteobacteria bacterium]|nr:outer membrane beta-barrel protein [Deltaproteobacteria bacterium]